MRVLSSQEASIVAGGALIVGQNLGLGLSTGASTGSGTQTSLVGRLLGSTVGNVGAGVTTDKLLYLGRSSNCGCPTPV